MKTNKITEPSNLDNLHSRNPRSYLSNITTKTDCFSVDESGELLIDGAKSSALLAEFGSPLYVVSEKTVRANFKRISNVFNDLWPSNVVVMYAIKANNSPAIRAIIHDEGGGGDCFGLGELHSTFSGGADPYKVVMNGSNKSVEELEAGVDKGVIINIDALDEIGMLERIAEEKNTDINVNIRIKCAPALLDDVPSDYLGLASKTSDFLRREKWGFSKSAATDVAKMVAESQRLKLLGYSIHTPRFTQNSKLFAECTAEFADIVVEISRTIGIDPKILDIGGGWPRDRDPESRHYDVNDNVLERFAADVVQSILAPLKLSGIPIPELRLEPGRSIIGNAVVLLGRIGAIKRDMGMIWVNTDITTNNLMRIDTSASAYHVTTATGMDRPFEEFVQIVGSTCIDSRIADNWPVPSLTRGEPLAVFDAGMYAESSSTQFNGIPRPATVLVNGSDLDIIRERETVEDVFCKSRIPKRLKF